MTNPFLEIDKHEEEPPKELKTKVLDNIFLNVSLLTIFEHFTVTFIETILELLGNSNSNHS